MTTSLNKLGQVHNKSDRQPVESNYPIICLNGWNQSSGLKRKLMSKG